MTDPGAHKKAPRPPARRMRAKKARRHIWFEATVRRDHVHVQASAPTKWFRALRWVVLIILITLIIRFLPELWQAIQLAVQTIPK